jgi:hypothetical protein
MEMLRLRLWRALVWGVLGTEYDPGADGGAVDAARTAGGGADVTKARRGPSGHAGGEGAMMRSDTWTDCYRDGWQGLIVSDAYAHPAKFARGLIQHIYQHAREEGWIAPGSVVLDCFGGVSLGALDACLMGCTHVAVELEPMCPISVIFGT